MRTFMLLLFTLALVSGCTTSTSTQELQDLMKTYHEETLKMNPVGATYQGDSRYNDYLPNYLSDAVISKHKAFYSDILQQLNAIDEKSLREEDK